MDSAELSGYHEDGRGRQSGVLQTLALAHGFLAANDHGVGIMDDAVTDGVCQQRIGQLFRPARDILPCLLILNLHSFWCPQYI